MRRRLLLGLVPAVPLAALGASCQPAPAAAVGLVMKAPAGLLDQATAVSLTVFEASLAKGGKDGHVAKMPSGSGVQTFDLDKSGCKGGATWCKDIELDQDGSKQTFAVIATDATGTLAEGCASAVIDQSPLEVKINVVRT